MKFRLGIFLISVLLLSPLNALAVDRSLSESELQHLSEDLQWRNLLHYHQIGLFSTDESQVDDPAFFLSSIGKTNALAELKVTLKAFKYNDALANNNASAACRFPARFHWLKNILGETFFPHQKCKVFDAWFKKIDAKSLTLIFPTAYLNSPSSMFGHTLIRINRRSGTNHLLDYPNHLLDYSINYAANSDPEDNELVFSYKGLSGGYQGVFSILPYYQKVKEYNFLESRDIWEYDLALKPKEVDQFVRHIWEIQHTHFDYYFFSENCSYQLLTLLDAASARFNFSTQFHLSASPVDTVRVLRQAKQIKKAHFRPSMISQLNHILQQVDDTQKHTAHSLVKQNTSLHQLGAMKSKQKAQTLELAYQYQRYLRVQKKQTSPEQNSKALKLLSARSKLAEKQVFSPYPKPKYRDDQGHNTHRLETLIGNDNDSNYTQFGLRMAYHDLLDPSPGYLKGAKLEMFHLKIRKPHHTQKNKGKRVKVQEIGLIDIESYSPRNNFVTPLSWRISTGFKRPKSQINALSAYLSAGAGVSYLYHQQQFYALLDSELNVGHNLDKGYRLASGPHIGWLSQHERWNAKLDYSYNVDVMGAEFKERNISLAISRNISKNWQLRVQSSYFEYHAASTHTKIYDQPNEVGLLYYF